MTKSEQELQELQELQQSMNKLIILKAADLAFTFGPERKQLKQQITDQLMELDKEQAINLLLEAVCVAGATGYSKLRS